MNTEIEDLACLYILDRLDARERALFEARLARDQELAALTRGLESALERRIRSLPRHEPPAGLLPGIEERIAGRPAARIWVAAARWGIAAVIAVGVGILAVESLRPAPVRPYVIVVGLDSIGSKLAELPVRERPGGPDASFIQLASLAARFWEKPEQLPVKLDSAGRSGRGYALFDPGSDQGFIAILQPPQAERGKVYRLWLVDNESGRVSQAGVLPSAGPAAGLYFFSVAPAGSARSDRIDFFVTAEDASEPGSTQPRGKVVLGDRRI
jgi:anti-sigma-K factor RskA